MLRVSLENRDRAERAESALAEARDKALDEAARTINEFKHFEDGRESQLKTYLIRALLALKEKRS